MEGSSIQDQQRREASDLENVLKSLAKSQAALVDAGLVIASAHVAFAIKAIEDAA